MSRNLFRRIAGRAVLSLAAAAVLPVMARATILRPDHLVVVIMEDRFSNALGDGVTMPYTNNTLAIGGLVYSNSHGINNASQQGQMSYLTLYSGFAQGVTNNVANNPQFTTPNLAQSLNNSGKSFIGFSEGLPSAGSQVPYAAGSGPVHNADGSTSNYTVDDIYQRNYNPMSQFSNVGVGKTTADVSKTFDDYKTLTSGGAYQNLPTVSFVVPNVLNNTHGSNDMDPFATDPSQYSNLRSQADFWLSQNMDGYLQWAKTHNSLLLVTGDEGDRAYNFNAGTTTLVNGDTRLFVPGTSPGFINDNTMIATIEDMYGLARIGDPSDPANTTNAQPLYSNAAGQLAVPEPASIALGGVVGLLLLRRKRAAALQFRL